jgi:hypothetical protein
MSRLRAFWSATVPIEASLPMTNPSVIGGMANSLIRACKTNFGPGDEAGIMISLSDGERSLRHVVPPPLPEL